MKSKKSKKILFVYRTPRGKVYNDWEKGKGPDSLLFGFNHLNNIGYQVEFFDSAYSPLNIFHPLLYPLEHSIISVTRMGFKLDQALWLLSRLNSYDVIVGTGDSAGLPLLALKYFGLIKTPIIFMTAGLAGALKGKTTTWVGRFYKKILPMADVFTSYAQVEIDFFEKEIGIKKGKIIYVPLATDFEYFSQKSQPKDGRPLDEKSKRNVICAVGEQWRDYKTFFEAVGDLPIQAEIVCHPDNIKGLEVPSNVKIHLNISVQEVLKIYQRSIISVVPCFERFRSSGQMVLLESASAGLPIIASKIMGMTTAFDFKHNKHLLFTKPEDSKDLKHKIKTLLNDQKLRERLGQNASILVRNNYTTYHLAKRLANFIDRL